MSTESLMATLDSMLITPVFIGQRPLRSEFVHGSRFCLMAVYPYAMTSNEAVTLPEIAETPMMVKLSVLLSGVKATLKRVAEKLELA